MPESLKEILDALGERDADGLRSLLSDRGVDVAAVRGLAPWNSPNRADGLTHRVLYAMPGDESTTSLIKGALDTATTALDRALLGLYIWHECRESWERSYQFQPILKTIDDTCAALDAHARRSGEHAATDAVEALLRVLKRAVLVEDKLTVGDLAAHARACGTAARAARELRELARADGLDADLADFMAAEGDGNALYYSAVEHAARATRDYLDGEGGLDEAVHVIDEALREGADEDLLSPIDMSELRAHRARLTALRAASGRPWLRVEHGHIIYIYPFGTRGPSPHGLADEVLAHGMDWRPLGLRPLDVQAMFDVDDVFAGYSPEDRRFDGTTLTMPRVRVQGLHAYGELELTCELRFSKLGNHYLKLTGELSGRDPHELAQSLFLAAPEHGQVKVLSGERPPWPRLSSYAVSLIEALEGVRETGKALRVSVRPGMYHVIVSVLAASVGTGPGATERRPLDTAADFTALVGAEVLTHPVPNAIGAIADWICHLPAYDAVPGPGEATGLLARTTNTTLLVMPASPSFLVEMHVALAEFAGSLDGLFSAWSDALDSHERSLARVVHALENAASGESHHLAGLVRDIQLCLRQFAYRTGSVLALLHSPALVAAPVDARTLRTLLTLAGFDRAEAQINRKIDELLDDRVATHLDAIARKEEQERDRADRMRLDTVVTAVAATGAAGVAQVAQTGLGLTGPLATAVLFAALVVFAVAMVWWARSRDFGPRALIRRLRKEKR